MKLYDVKKEWHDIDIFDVKCDVCGSLDIEVLTFSTEENCAYNGDELRCKYCGSTSSVYIFEHEINPDGPSSELNADEFVPPIKLLKEKDAELAQKDAEIERLKATIENDTWTGEIQRALEYIPSEFVKNDRWEYGVKRMAEELTRLHGIIERVANIVHHGGLIGYDTDDGEGRALKDIRLLTVEFWNKAEANRLQMEAEAKGGKS